MNECKGFRIDEIKKNTKRLIANNKLLGPGGIPMDLFKYAPVPLKWRVAHITSRKLEKLVKLSELMRDNCNRTIVQKGTINLIEYQIEQLEKQSGFRPRIFY